MLTPIPGTIDFTRWEHGMASGGSAIDGVPLTRYWLIPSARRPKVYASHPSMSADEIRRRTQLTWDEFYRFSRIWQRSRCVQSLRARLAFVLISKLYRQMYANTGIATDSARVSRSVRRAKWLGHAARRLFVTAPMPDLQVPAESELPVVLCARADEC
jgi:hypothetical protein